MSERSDEADRTPEARMGQEFISAWANQGDVIVIGNIGKKLYAAKMREASPQEIGEVLAKAGRSKSQNIIAKALKAKGKPKRIVRKQTDFVRDPHVVAAALIRAGGKCEGPGCTSKLFKREDGSTFLEVHHVVPLSEDGFDELANAAALCPMCHRELHFGKSRLSKRVSLANAVKKAMAEL
jgi:predicted HNH restriction endonuclease